MTNNTTASALTDEQRAAINMAISVLTPLAMDEYGDALRALLTSPRAAVPAADPWLISGSLLYRLTDERRPTNRDEISVTMADGSRESVAREARARQILALLDAAPAAPVAEAEPAPNPLRRRVERLLVELHAEGRLSEGQCAKMLDISSVEWRELVEFLAPGAQAVAEYDGNHVQNHCTECNEHEAECTCTPSVAADGAAMGKPSEIERVIEERNDAWAATEAFETDLAEILGTEPGSGARDRIYEAIVSLKRAAVSPATAEQRKAGHGINGIPRAAFGPHTEADRIDHCCSCGEENDPQKDDVCPVCHAECSLVSTWGEFQHMRYRNGQRYANNGPQPWEDGPQPATAEPTDYAAIEREHFGDPDKRTGIYAPATADTTGYCTRSVCGCEGSRIETKQGCYHWRIVSETATADERAALREMLDDARNEFTMVREALGVAYEPHQTLLERTLDAARASQAAAPASPACRACEAGVCSVHGPEQSMAGKRVAGAPAEARGLVEMIDNNVESLNNLCTAADEKALTGLSRALRKVSDTLTRCRAAVSIRADAGEAVAIGFRTRIPGFDWVPWLTDNQETIRKAIADALAIGSEASKLYSGPVQGAQGGKGGEA
ncbi:hypothetical protein B7759_01357 [Burkholderia glumae]|uniref:hypothetical protein n=1 Tax=Burkholderia glumae TaxID=337 RepID=UPI001AE716F2|nr:hypothetical protein [Burkholderia glumae]QTP32779.1 hypothetical protein B7759_01357 [Burkholderia glumae]